MQVAKGDPGFENATCYLNGVPQDDWVCADDVAGWVKCYKRDDKNVIMFDVGKDSYQPLFVTHEGSIQITGYDAPGPVR